MAQTCSKCSRANPPDAVYCYYDGFVLAGHSRNGGPVAVGAQPFGSPFVFPTGRTCRSFNELALACQDDWASARDLLRQGYLEAFLGGLGRMDLVMAAKEAARYPDADRGLDQFLNKLPGDTLGSPKLAVETTEINLGVLAVGTERQFELHLENQGMRLLFGTITCTDKNPWLTLGDAAGTLEKTVQFGHELRVPVRVNPNRLRAGNKPLEGTLVIDTNGGTATVNVRAEVPVKPFPPGVLGGAKTPRQVAEKAKANPKGAAVLFENGAVAAWYKSNGWTYPVQGPSASGIGAVQQFFEALGLTPAPKVAISERKVALRGEPGQTLRHTVEIKSQEKRPVYAHGVSNQPWLEVSRAKLNGRTATINLAIPSVPDRPGETLTAQLVVQSNGNQRFVVPVTLEVGGAFNFAAAEPVLDVVEAIVETPKPPPVADITPTPAPVFAPPPSAPIVRRPIRRGFNFLHLVPAALLALAVFLVIAVDVGIKLFAKDKPEVPDLGGPIDLKKGDVPWDFKIANTDPLLGVNFNAQHRFGVLMLKEPDPKDPARKKRLTFKEDGGSNNTVVMIDGSGHLFGAKQGLGKSLTGAKERRLYPDRPDRHAYESIWDYPNEKIRVRQYVEIVPGEQSQRLDTLLVFYTVQNYGEVPRTVGLRVMLDTFIGANDGVPFVIPGQKGLLTDLRDFGEKEIPDYIEALENPDLSNPGTIAHLGLKGINLPKIELEPVHRMLICRWPGSETRWEPAKNDIRSIQGDPGEPGDSCVFIYWPELPMRKGETRYMAFTYGLGKMSVAPTTTGGGSSQLGLTAGGSFRPGGEFTVTAYVKNPKEGQQVQLELPKGLTFAHANETADKPVDAPDAKAGYSQVSWKVRAGENGEHEIHATYGKAKASTKVTVRSGGGIFSTN